MGSSGSKKLPKEDMDFLMENTNFTKQQIKAWYSGFMVRRYIVINVKNFHGSLTTVSCKGSE